MANLIRIACIASAILATSACARFDAGGLGSAPAAPQLESSTQTQSPVAPSVEFSSSVILSFLPSEVQSKLSVREKSEAASAQFYALQYGRVGATREWTGDSATRGEISVGPYIKVNELDCREFSHTVLVSTERYLKSGTSCREQDGQWNVVG
ncbi:hypothetical protein [Maritalea porphyrae]|jgi:surface antigen|uniref:hypothetical protein n=1 Tax=Maritalea porphyrae TaxID=880732 RepID=UPI0022B03C1E|nr:hypothetical protein [Maritalea porphyrae]MCZ4271143.1 hypothetical protein [Maritalea porphyrae]